MDTDLREERGTTIRPEAVLPGRPGPGARWPIVATGLVLVVLAAVAVLVLTQGSPQPVFGPDHRAANVEGMMTDVREGSGHAPLSRAVYPNGLENPGAYASTTDRGAYAHGAFTATREGSGYEPVERTSYADGALTEIREGA